jgi:hypothetical protein
MSTVKLPDGTKTIWKNENDGGTIVYAYLLGAGLINKETRVSVCGVNLSACVIDTARGIAHRPYEEHALCDHVSVESSLCGDGARFRVRILP